MAIERTELTDTEDNNESDEAAKREAAEQAREQRILDAEKRANAAEVAKARAEGEAEALKRTPAAANVQWDDARWEAEGAQRGMTGQQMKATAELSAGIAQEATKGARAEAEEAKREAREAKAEMAKLKASKGSESVTSAFYEKNPAIKAHRATVEEFLDTYPDKDTVDGATLQKRLALAQDFVKGRVKETMRNNKPGQTGSSRLEGADEFNSREERGEELGEFDPKGTGNKGAAYLMAGVHQSFGQDLLHDDTVDVWKKSLDEEGRGVAISSSEDVELAREMRRHQTAGGKRKS